MATNLPATPSNDSAAGTKLFFDTYGEQPLEFNAVEVDATTAFFAKRGFEGEAALTVSTTILKQAKLDGTPVFELLKTLETFNGLQLSTLIGEILNNNRVATSTLGFRTEQVKVNYTRNIVA